MIVIALLALFAGILCGTSGMDNWFLSALSTHKDLVLYVLMFSVGISIGLHHGLLRSIRQYHVKIFIIPFGVILGSLLGGAVCGILTGRSIFDGAAVASGLGWYSLSGVAVGNLAGAQAGSIAFLSNLLREIFSFFSIRIYNIIVGIKSNAIPMPNIRQMPGRFGTNTPVKYSKNIMP